MFCDHLYLLVYFSIGFVVDSLGTKCRQEGCGRYPPHSCNCCGASVYLSSSSVRLRSLRLWTWVQFTTFVNSHSYSGRSDEQGYIGYLYPIYQYYISLLFESYQSVGPYILCSVEAWRLQISTPRLEFLPISSVCFAARITRRIRQEMLCTCVPSLATMPD